MRLKVPACIFPVRKYWDRSAECSVHRREKIQAGGSAPAK